MPRTKSTFAFLPVLCAAATIFIACSNSGSASVHVKSSATGERDFAPKSSYAFAVTKSFTDINGKMSTAASYRTYVASYDLDSANFSMTMDKPLAADDQLRVVFSLVGDEGTNDKSPPKAGTYSAKADKFMKVEDVTVVSRKGGTDNKAFLDRSTVTGEVKVTSATADQIAGDINLTSGDTNIKGSFTAKVLKRK